MDDVNCEGYDYVASDNFSNFMMRLWWVNDDLLMMIWFCTKAAALEYGLDGMDLDVEDSGAGEDIQVDHGDGDGDGDGLVFF